MATLDWVIILAYLGVVAGLAVWVFKKRKGTPDDYFLADRNLGWSIVGASIFASNIGSEHLVGLAGSGATDGVALAHYELHAWCLLILAWVFVPFFMRSRVYTMPEFLERRFSPAARWVLLPQAPTRWDSTTARTRCGRSWSTARTAAPWEPTCSTTRRGSAGSSWTPGTRTSRARIRSTTWRP